MCKIQFTSGELERELSAQRISEIISGADGNPDKKFATAKAVLQKTEYSILKKHAGSALGRILEQHCIAIQNNIFYNTNVTEDMRLVLTPEDLQSLIGLESTRKLHSEFKAYHGTYPVSKIIICCSNIDDNKRIKFHLDPSCQDMFVSLNAEEIEGDSHVYLAGDGATWIEPVTGFTIFQSESVVHSTSPFTTEVSAMFSVYWVTLLMVLIFCRI